MSTYVRLSQLSPALRTLARGLGVTSIRRCGRRPEDLVRARWGEVTITRELAAIGFGLELIDWGTDSDYDHRWSLAVRVPWVSVFVRLPMWFFPNKADDPSGGEVHTWGFSTDRTGDYFTSELVFAWRRRRWYLPLPWHRGLFRKSCLLKTGNWYHVPYPDPVATRRRRLRLANRLRAFFGLEEVSDPDPDSKVAGYDWREVPRYEERHVYCYVLNSGDAQDVLATISLEEWEVRRWWLRWTSLGADVRRSIDVRFDEEVGEGRGSWKGGVLGCSFDLLPGELPVHGLRRMQFERRFSS